MVHIFFFSNRIQIEQTSQHKDLGILSDDHLKFYFHTSTAASKGNHMLGIIAKSFEFLEPEMVGEFKALE